MKRLPKDKLLFFSMLFLLSCAFVLLKLTIFNNVLLTESVARLIYGVVIILMIYGLQYRLLTFDFHRTFLNILIVLPALLISINNFPISAYFNGRTEITSTTSIQTFLLQCISIGFFEELVFRGLILSLLLNYLKEKKHYILKAMMISSLVFGFMHLFNLFFEAGLTATLLQVVYTTLTGLLWAAIFIITKNILYPIILHVIYNFLGLLYPTLGSVTNQFDTVTIIVTALLSLMVGCFYMYHILNIENVTFKKNEHT